MKTLTFSELNISPRILKSIEEMGFEEPTPIQIQTIPLLLAGRDVTGQAQTGTGKTAAFGIPVLQQIDLHRRTTQVIILSPTRELAIQIAEELVRLSHHLGPVTILPVYGGQPIERQLKALKNGAQIVVGTPGRVLDHLRRGTLSLARVKIVVLDEADQMLDMGFRDDIEAILKTTPAERQTVLFAATLPRPILEISRRFQKDPVLIKVHHREITVPSQIEQLYLEVRSTDKIEALSRVLDSYDPKLTLIFCNTKRRVDELASRIRTRGYISAKLHGDMKQSQRDRTMEAFRKGGIDILIATDVAARGIDVEGIDLVINYEVPQDVENYVHRIGRTARAGRSGRAITFVDPKEIYKLGAIQEITRISITRTPLPSAIDAAEAKMAPLVRKIRETVDNGEHERYVALIERIMVGDYTSLEIAAALLRIQMASQR